MGKYGIEEKIIEMMQKKRDLQDRTVHTSETSVTEMSGDELRQLVELQY